MADNTGMYVANRDVMVITTAGYALKFEKDKPKYVAPTVRKEMWAYGIVPVAEDETPFEEEEVTQEIVDFVERNDRIKSAIETMVEENKRGYFTGTGLPSAKVVARLSKLKDVDSKEVKAIWQEIKAGE